MSDILAPVIIATWRRTLLSQKRTIDSALAQVPDALLHQRPAPHINSIAIIIRHLSGNMLSRWTDFLTADGEKPWRDREAEFADGGETREELLALWERAWATTLAAIDALTPADLPCTITIRSEPHTVPEAVNRQISHYGYHAGQIMLLTRLLRGGDAGWQWTSIPPGETGEFNRSMTARHSGHAASGKDVQCQR